MGLSLRQLLCSGAAIGAAVAAYFALQNILDKETVSWLCIVCASPVAAAGFFIYDGMSFEKFLRAAWETLFLRSGPRVWKSENRYLREKKRTGAFAMLCRRLGIKKREVEELSETE